MNTAARKLNGLVIRAERAGPIAMMMDRATRADAVRPLVSEHTAKHGSYGQEALPVTAGEFEGEDPGNRRVTRNRNSSPVDAWHAAKLITDAERDAIRLCETLWTKAGRMRGLVAGYGARVAGSDHGDGMAQQMALDQLARWKRMVCSEFWDVFEAVCRHQEPAGKAGSRLANNAPQAQACARTVVRIVASVIANDRGLTRRNA